MVRLLPVSRLVEFVRSGFPDAAPDRGYLPLFALLRRRLTDEEVAVIAQSLTQAGPPIVHDDIHSTDLNRSIEWRTWPLPLTDLADRVIDTRTPSSG